MSKKIKNVVVCGLGKVGQLVAELLQMQGFNVTGIDPFLNKKDYIKLPFKFLEYDLRDYHRNSMDGGLNDEYAKMLNKQDAIISCLPFNLNKEIVDIAMHHKLHYFDLTEDTETAKYIKSKDNIAKENDQFLVPQCGLAPGWIGIIGSHLIKKFKTVESLELKVGALPQTPRGKLGYAFNWCAESVINEYIKDAEVLHDYKLKEVPSMEGNEILNINGKEFEAALTSGGLGTLCETYEGKIKDLSYKTMRYPGHFELMRFLLNDLGFRDKFLSKDCIMQNQASTLLHTLEQQYPKVTDDIVYIYASCLGTKAEGYLNSREELVLELKPLIINKKHQRAISWTTASSLVAVIEMVSNNKISEKGFVKQEDICYDNFRNTKMMKAMSKILQSTKVK